MWGRRRREKCQKVHKLCAFVSVVGCGNLFAIDEKRRDRAIVQVQNVVCGRVTFGLFILRRRLNQNYLLFALKRVFLACPLCLVLDAYGVPVRNGARRGGREEHYSDYLIQWQSPQTPVEPLPFHNLPVVADEILQLEIGQKCYGVLIRCRSGVSTNKISG